MTQEQLARAADIGRPFISRIETGRFSVTLETIGALAKALRTSPADLIELYAL
jgi:transcriptional regulator with XRE-family HTH domain